MYQEIYTRMYKEILFITMLHIHTIKGITAVNINHNMNKSQKGIIN